MTGGVVLLILAANVLNLDTGLTSGNSFRGDVDSVQGQEILARNFAAGSSAPTDVVVPDRAKVAAVTSALKARKDIVSAVSPPAFGPPGAHLSVTLTQAPYSTAALGQVTELRSIVRAAGGEVDAGRRADGAGIRPARRPRRATTG